MPWWHRSLILMTLLAAAGPLAALPDPAGSDQEANRQALDKARQDPAHYSRLRRDLRVFLALPPEQQERLRRLDHDLHEEDSATLARLHRAMERYADWLDRLPASDRQAVAGAADPKVRLQKIKEIRLRQWVERLPRAYRDQIQQAAPGRQAVLIRQYRAEEKYRQQEWKSALRNWEELLTVPWQPPWLAGVKDFANKNLMPLLPQGDKDRLHAVDGQWPLYPQTLVELADKYLPVMPGPSTGPTRFEELPEEVQKVLASLPPAEKNFLKNNEGSWPTYAMKVTASARRHRIRLPKQLGPSRPEDFSMEVRRFTRHRLLPVLDVEERRSLKDAEGRWPNYARTLAELERKHRVYLPGTFLPGASGLWDRFRIKSPSLADPEPEVTDQALREFVQNELTAEDRAVLNLATGDPASRERAKKEYFKRHPNELKRLQQSDQRKKKRPAGTGATTPP
jgi:hypothetical protein